MTTLIMCIHPHQFLNYCPRKKSFLMSYWNRSLHWFEINGWWALDASILAADPIQHFTPCKPSCNDLYKLASAALHHSVPSGHHECLIVCSQNAWHTPLPLQPANIWGIKYQFCNTQITDPKVETYIPSLLSNSRHLGLACVFPARKASGTSPPSRQQPSAVAPIPKSFHLFRRL